MIVEEVFGSNNLEAHEASSKGRRFGQEKEVEEVIAKDILGSNCLEGRGVGL